MGYNCAQGEDCHANPFSLRKDSYMTGYITSGDEITTSWLTAILRQDGLLAQGEVVSFEHRDSGAFNSQTSFLTLAYSNEAPLDLPMHMVLKLNQNEEGTDEIRFYQQVAALPDHPPIIVPCYVAAYDEQSGSSYLLLQDLSETHAPPITRDQQIGLVEGVPTPQAIEGVVDSLARLHAY